MESHRENELKSVGIDFSKTCITSALPESIYFGLEIGEKCEPLYKNGIIYAMPYNKDDVLVEMLKQLYD